jgi:SPP1 gp7 family putative phage head morphogenesis protein
LLYLKRRLSASWTEFAELFGAPFRLGKTNVRDEALRDNMYDMLENMGRNAYGVFDTDDDLEFIRDGKTDSHHVYNELIERVNSELSKLILGSTMTMDDGSSRSQSEVHERTSGAINKEDAFFIESLVNDELIPWLNVYHGFNITGKWVFDDTENTTKEQQFKIDAELVKLGFNVPKEYFTETYGTPIDEKEEPDEPGGPTKKSANGDELENSLKKKTTLANIYAGFTSESNVHVCTNELDYEDTPPPVWSEGLIDDVITGVYAGKYTLANLPERLYRELGERLTQGIYDGLATGKALTTIADPGYINTLRNNVFTFSGAKTWQEINLMSSFLLDESGNPRSFKQYKDFARQTFDTFNVNYLRTEINHAKGSAQMADKWKQFDEEADLFPFLRYVTAGDERVRGSHKALNGVIKPVNSPFWEENAPLNGWNCRCDLKQVEEAVETPDAEIKKRIDKETDGKGLQTPDYMKNNPGRVIFGKEHPYFKVPRAFNKDKANNFGLPAPKPLKDETIVKNIKEAQKEAQFKPAKSIKEAKKIIEGLGVDLVRTKGLNIDYANNIIEVLQKVPKAAIPNIITDFTNYGKMSGRKLSAAGNKNYALKINRSDLKIDNSELTPQIAEKYKHLKSDVTGQTTIYDNLNLVAFNTRKFKKPIDVPNSKKEVQKWFNDKNEAYFIDSALKDEKFTIYHELGHVYDTNKRLTGKKDSLHWALHRWHTQTKIGHLKENEFGYTEAFADAFADYFTTGGQNLPPYVMEEMKKIIK